MVNKTIGPLQQHLRLNVDGVTTFEDVLQIVRQYYQSRHLANWRPTSDTSAPMEIGMVKGKGRKEKEDSCGPKEKEISKAKEIGT